MNTNHLHRFFIVAVFGSTLLPIAVTKTIAEDYPFTIDEIYKKNVVSSPEMADMIYNCVNSIDYSTGQVDIRIPLFEVECGTLKLPIYLSYKSSGVKISDPSGWVGQNWTLHAEPAISRVPKGHLDSNYQCEFDPINTIFQAENHTSPNFFSGIDAMPDEYYFSLPTASGMFMYSKGHISEDSMYVCLPFDDVKVVRDTQNIFKMTDADGTIYYFGGGQETNQVEYNYVSAWHASSIIAANGIDSITFSYNNNFHYEIKRHLDYYTVADLMMDEDGGWKKYDYPYDQVPPDVVSTHPDIEPYLRTPIVYETLDKSTKSYYVNGSHNLIWENTRIIDDVNYFPNIIIQGNRLSSISFCGNLMTFIDETIGNDQNRKRLKKITVTNCNNQNIKVIDFSYYEGYVNTDRYYLSEVAISSSIDTVRYTFDYESRFDTNFRGIPDCSSRELDLWGYWTNVTRPQNETLVPNMTLYTSVPSSTTYSLNYLSDSLTIGTMSIGTIDKSRATNEEYMRIGSLKSITYPTGLKDIFIFEANRARIADGNSCDENSKFDIRKHLLCNNDSIFQIGGLRIKGILTVEGNDTIQRRTFKYGMNEDGTGTTPVLGNINYYLRVATKKYFHIEELGWEYCCSSRYRTLSSDPVIPLTYSNGMPVKYTYVTEYNGTNDDNTGKTVYKYNNPQYLPNNSSALILSQSRIEDPTVDRYGIMQSDHLTEKISYKRDATGYSEIEKDIYNYDLLQKTTTSISGSEVKFETCGFYPIEYKYVGGEPYSQIFHANDYSCTPTVYLLKTVEHKVTHENGSASTTTTYNYNNPHDKQLTSKIISRSGHASIREEYLHPQQMGNENPYAEMASRNILTPVIRTTYTRNGKSIERENSYSSLNNYNGGQMFLPTSLKLKTDRMSEAETRLQYQYNRYGKLRMATKDDDENETYIYSYNSQYPIAEVQNATWYDVTMNINPNTMEQIEASANLTDAQANTLRNALIGIVAQTGGTALANLYRFKPLVGMTFSTAPNGLVTKYAYDGLNRLKTVSLMRGNVEEKTQTYSYQFQPLPRITTRSYLTDDGSDWMETVTYLDGKGREKETVRPWALPDGSTLVSFNEYDRFGRLIKEWNPARVTGSDSSYVDFNTFSAASQQMYNDNNPYTLSVYEASPLDRVEQKYVPGSAWQTAGKCKNLHFLFNSSVTDSLKCLKFVVRQDTIRKIGYYQTGSLDVEIITDEDGHAQLDFKDLLGNLVLSRRIVDGSFLDTYYVRDEWGNVQAVLPPMLANTMTGSSSSIWKWTNTHVKNYAYLYEYDDRYRMTSKKLPGCEPILYTYDSADRMVAMQDGELRNSGRRRFYLYDPLGRLCIQGTTSQSVGEDIMRVARTNGTAGFMNTGYGPTLLSASLPTASSCELAFVNYYDDNQYSFISHYTQFNANIRDSLDLSTTQIERGMLVGTWQKASNGEALLSTSSYDRYGRMSRNATVGLGSSLSMSDFDYTFTGELSNSRTSIYRLGTGNQLQLASTERKINIFDFPHNKMLHKSVISIKGVFNSAWMTDTLTYSYDELGNLASLDRDGASADMTYTYDLLHGWVKEISSTGGFQQKLYREDNANHPLYNGSISAMTWKVPNNSILRRYDYTYDGLNRLTEGAYSQLPNILPRQINSTGDDLLTMGDLGNYAMPLELIPVTGGIGGGLVGPGGFYAIDRYTEKIYYDHNSNIMGIERYGMNNLHNYGLIDSLEIIRNGNQLKTIEDYAVKHLTYTGASDFYDGDSSSSEYLYNENGALVSDFNREIDWTYYDNLGNTREICFCDHSSTEYIYAADGTKLRTIHHPVSTSGVPKDSTDYIGNLILKDGQPSMYLFDGGYATFNTSGAVDGWHYYIKDYIGNNRMVVNKNGTVEQVTHYYPYGGVIGDISTNENVQKYKFEGKELDRTFGLDNYDIHARQYFAMAPSWDRIDKKAEDYYPISPYSYCGGDPINKVDLNGDSICVLLARKGAIIFGHMAILIQDKKDHKWHYFSKEGHDRISAIGEKSYDTVKAFLDSDDEVKYGKDRYTDSYMIPTDENDIDSEGKTPDERAKEAAIQEITIAYDRNTANCSHVVASALTAAGKPNGYGAGLVEDIIPNKLFYRIMMQNENNNRIEDLWERIKSILSKYL